MYGEKVLRSFVVPKHKFPKGKEQILAVEVNDHAWNWQYFEGNIGPGYGEGSVKCLFREDIEIERLKTTCFTLNNKSSITEDLQKEVDVLKRRLAESESIRQD